VVPDRDAGGDIGIAGLIGAQILQGEIGFSRLVRRIGIQRTEASLVITSLMMAPIDLRLANHWRRMRVSSFVASVLSSRIARVDQR
jgi:hypothetical protein